MLQVNNKFNIGDAVYVIVQEEDRRRDKERHEPCETCHGSGELDVPVKRDGKDVIRVVKCPDCEGRGYDWRRNKPFKALWKVSHGAFVTGITAEWGSAIWAWGREERPDIAISYRLTKDVERQNIWKETVMFPTQALAMAECDRRNGVTL